MNTSLCFQVGKGLPLALFWAIVTSSTICSAQQRVLTDGSTAQMEQPEPGVLACSAVFIREGEKEEKRYASAFFFIDPAETGQEKPSDDCRVFMATAAHNLSEGGHNMSVMISPQKTFPIVENGEFQNRVWRDSFLIDVGLDLAVLQCTPSIAKNIRAYDDYLPGERFCGRLYAGVSRRQDVVDLFGAPAAPLVPRGGTAASVGTVSVQGGVEATANVAYGCTLSRYEEGRTLQHAFAQLYRPPDKSHHESEAFSTPEMKNFRSAMRKRLISTRFLTIETQSIRRGFSGSPIMISNDHYQSHGEIVGMVIGGSPYELWGRSAWAVPFSEIAQGAASARAANESRKDASFKKEWQEFTRDVLQAESAIIDEHKQISGRWIASTKRFDHLRNKLGLLFTPVLAKGYHAGEYVEYATGRKMNYTDVGFLGEGLPPRTEFQKPALEQALAAYKGYSLLMNGYEFHKDCLNGAVLMNPVFEDCLFVDTEFYGAVITGAEFRKCWIRINGAPEVRFTPEYILKPCKPAAGSARGPGCGPCSGCGSGLGSTPCRPAVVAGARFTFEDTPSGNSSYVSPFSQSRVAR